MGLAVGLVVGVSGGGVAPNTAPTNSVPGAQSVYVGSTLTFSSGGGNALTVADPDGGNLTVTLAAIHGTMSLSGTSGLSFLSGDGTDDATMQFTGTAAAINAALSGMVYTPTAGYAGADTLTLTTNDGRGGIDQDTVAITVAFDLTNLAAYWKLSDTADASGNSNTLSNNGAEFVAGKLGNCAELGAGDIMTAADSPSLSMGATQAFHCDGWLMHTTSGDNHIVFIKGNSFNTSDYEYGLRINTSDQLVSDTSNGTTDKDFVASELGALTEDTWHYFAYWQDPVADIVGMQINGNSVTSPWNGGCWNSTFTFKIGGAAGTLKGRIEDLAIFKDARNAAYRAARYNGGAGRELS